MTDESPPISTRLLGMALEGVTTHALILLSPDGTIVAWLAGAQRLFGYAAAEIIGKHVSVLFTREDLQKDLSIWEMRTSAESGESEDDRWQVRRDGARIWVSGTLTALRDAQGELIGFAKIMRNRVDQKSQIETLESRVHALQQSAERKNNFISTLAHELRNPLGAASNAVALLQHLSTEDSEVALTVGMIKRQVEFMGRMIDDLLEVTRVSAGKVELRREAGVLQDVICRAVETCRPLIDQQTQLLHVLLPDAPIEISADLVRLQQVFVNLIQNAAKYTRFGGIIWIKGTAEGEEAVVRVQDTGIGISPDLMPHIFELFTQADFASQPEAGLGIGLSVVKQTMALHGGTVQAASDGIGKGSEFTVRLPLPDARQQGP